MAVASPISAVEAGAEMFERRKTPAILTHRSEIARPLSQATENLYTEFEDDDSDVEETSLKSSNQSFDDRRRSNTTVSSYNEVATPLSEKDRPFEVRIKPVEGPSGPHLFRASQASAEFMFDFALQMSPVETKDEPVRSQTSFSQQTVVPPPQHQQQPKRIPFRSSTRQHSRRQSLSPVYSSIPGLPTDVHKWSSQDVVDWMYNTGVELPIVERFESHDISGTVLLDLQFDDLKELGIQSFGKRHQLWSSICDLKGGEAGPSPVPTPFQDISRPCTKAQSRYHHDEPNSACPDTPIDGDETPISASGGHKKRRGKKHKHQRQHHDDDVLPAESASIVAIEQLLPKPHTCEKGNNCRKWKKQQKLLQRIEQENGWPVSPTNGGHIMITGDPGNAATAPNMLQNIHRQQESDEDYYRPTSEAVPSIVASSDLLGPGQLPEFALHEEQLQRLAQRDPQENVKHFLSFQHMTAAPERSPSPPLEMFPPNHFDMSSTMYHGQPQPPLRPVHGTPGPLDSLKNLPKLSIPRAATASPSVNRRNNTMSPVSVQSPSRTVTNSPANMYRHGTPASEMDIPVTAIPSGPVSRDCSQSVPPNMQYRDPISLSRSHSRADWRRPSFALPSVAENENEVFSPTTGRRTSDPLTTTLTKSQAQYGTDCTHAGWMKKRKTRLLRHEWTDAHFRLRGTQLAMHASPIATEPPLETLNVHEYSVACSSGAANSKLSAALKTLKLSDRKVDATAFAFQLVPEIGAARNGNGLVNGNANGKDGAKDGEAGLLRKKSVRKDAGKTHHFTVKHQDERIDWMRDLMLAKAKGQRERGFAVQVNGSGA